MALGATTALPSSTGSSSKNSSLDRAKLAEDFDKFLLLLTTQLQHQDPTNPLDSNEFTAQLVQFTSVEQQVKQNTNLENIASLLESRSGGGIEQGLAVSYLGKEVVAKGDERKSEGFGATWDYVLGADSAKTTLNLFNEQGDLVLTTTGNTTSGEHEFVWDGRDALGEILPAGTYRLEVKAEAIDGSTVASSTDIGGQVGAIDIDDGVITLKLTNGLSVGLDKIKRVVDTSIAGL